MNSNSSHQLKKYLQFEQVEAHKQHVKQLIGENKNEELEKLFGSRLKFGTAGIRGQMGPGYSQMNDLVIIQTSQGLVSYLIEVHGEQLCKQRGVIIGRDSRHNSRRFARLAALAFIQKSIPVYSCEYIVPTPFVAFGVKLFNCLCGIMITASHNPKQDNGYKVYWSNGAQILSPHDVNIQKHIEMSENLRPWPKAWQHETLISPNAITTHGSTSSTSSPSSTSSIASIETKASPLPKEFEGLHRVIYAQLRRSYFEYIEQLVGDFHNQNLNSSICITYTTMHGVGHSFLSRAFEIAGFNETFPVEAQKKPDPEFTTVKFPNPEEAGALDLAFETASHANSNLILATDPDADRCAAAIYDPIAKVKRILTGNEIGALLGWWIWHCHKTKVESVNDLGQIHDDDSSYDALSQSSKSKDTVIPRETVKPEDCYMLSTAVSSRFLQSMARVEGFKFIETLTGFKYMGNVAHDLIQKQNKKVLFAYEEAIGFMVDSQILDKDGISAAVQLAQCAAYLMTTHNRTLESQLDWLFSNYGYHFSLNSYYICYNQRTIRAIFQALQSDYPKYFGSTEKPEEFVVTRIRDLNNGFDNGCPQNKATLPTSSNSFMVTFFIGNEIQFTIRTSGTEPKIKYYSEIVAPLPASVSSESSADDPRSLAKCDIQAKLSRFVGAAVERCLKPSLYNLEAN